MFKPIAEIAATAMNPERTEPTDAGIKRVFMVLHGYYGNLFLSKFATGIESEDGEDQGIANARRVWSFGLAEFDVETVKLALRRCQQAHPEFPPSLPQFVALCAAIQPRPVFRPVMPTTQAIELSEEARAELRARERERLAALAQRLKEAPPDSPLTVLKQCIAKAVGDAGGDEGAALLRLDRMLAPRAAA
jgi:hypothetical protein